MPYAVMPRSSMQAVYCRPALYPAQHGITLRHLFLGFRHHFKMSFSMPRRYSRCLSVAAAALSRGVASACHVVCRVCRLITTRPGHGPTARAPPELPVLWLPCGWVGASVRQVAGGASDGAQAAAGRAVGNAAGESLHGEGPVDLRIPY
jgi:hypothetical protein